jgi:hypothetical protein
MGVLPLVATGIAVWRRPDATAWWTLAVSAGTVAVGVLVFIGAGLLTGVPAG